ncbi:putative glycosyl transferase CAP10 domain-containing protein [Helianthus annuus]|nr:putative glycosyl transferase CAP10 domain-containing protein [Helianthus annuus]
MCTTHVPEVNIPPWVKLSKELEQGNQRRKWTNREPFAYWKGNTYTGVARRDLARCNSDGKHEWNARIHHLVNIYLTTHFFCFICIIKT